MHDVIAPLSPSFFTRLSHSAQLLYCTVLYCSTFVVLALDEPTTNLDEANKAGLAYSLARIIANRSRQSNFQLICITHDEDFVRMMNTEMSAVTDFSLPEYFFRVKRVEDLVHRGKYFSCIERVSWQDI